MAHEEFLAEVGKAGEAGAFFTDTHAHIHMKPLSEEPDAVLKRAADNFVKRVVTVGIDLADSRRAKAMSEAHDSVFFTAGVHPHDAAQFEFSQLAEFEKILESEKALAIGEIGLDYYYDHSPRERQKEVFLTFLDLAKTLGKPVVIHNRDSSADCVEILDSVLRGRDRNGIIHCFSGDTDLLRWALDNGFYISYAGPVTFEKSDDLRATLQYVPLDRLFIETDCPYLAPNPYRGKTNEPANVVYNAEEICKIKNIGLVDFALQMERNYTQLFGN